MRRFGRIIGLLGLGWLAWRMLGPERTPAAGGVQERPLLVPGRTVFVGRQELFVRETGPVGAPVIVLVHGWSFDGEMTYHRLVPLLADRYRVILPDMRNHGKSDRLRGRFEIEDVADDLAGVLDAIGVSRVDTIVGYSMGGMVAQAFARRYPGRCDRLVLGATAAYAIPRMRAAAKVAFVLARAVARVSTKESAIITYQIVMRTGLVEQRHGRWLWDSLMNRDATLFYESGFAVWRFDSRAWAAGLGVPVLVIIPSIDRVIAADAQRELAGLIPDARVIEMEGTGHEAVLARPDDIAQAIESFIVETSA
ncbi:MAG: alpha/beta hydrolase [Actinobacteria bacterium]|nr:MAG: alpha/beta hydrolase [Actinomycetota bacterium]